MFLVMLFAISAREVIYRIIKMEKSQVDSLSRLACLRFNDDEKADLHSALSNILRLMERLQDCDTSQVAPIAHPLDYDQRLREDMVTENDQRDVLVRNAPQTEAGFFLVPKVVE